MSSSDRAGGGKLPGLSFFMPAYNDASSLRRSVPEALAFLPQAAERYELIVVLDARSADGSREYLREEAARESALRVVEQLQTEPGYGRALALGWATACFPYVFYTDADGQYSLEDFPVFAELIRDADLVAGFRKKRYDPCARRATGAAYNFLARRLLDLGVRDIDCSFKLIRKDALARMSFTCVSGAAEAELFLQSRGLGLRVRQVPVRHLARAAGKSAFSRGPWALPETANIRLVWRELLSLRRGRKTVIRNQ